MTDELPSWPDALQAIVSLIGIPLTIYTLYKLVKKDKERESEIASLSAIANQLKDLQLLNEKRYIESKKPIVEFTCKKDYNLGGHYFIYFKNLNGNGQITKYEKFPKFPGMVSEPSNFGSEQEFAFSIIPPNKGGSLNLLMTYMVDNTYKFQQTVIIFYKMEELTIRGQQIFLE